MIAINPLRPSILPCSHLQASVGEKPIVVNLDSLSPKTLQLSDAKKHDLLMELMKRFPFLMHVTFFPEGEFASTLVW